MHFIFHAFYQELWIGKDRDIIPIQWIIVYLFDYEYETVCASCVYIAATLWIAGVWHISKCFSKYYRDNTVVFAETR